MKWFNNIKIKSKLLVSFGLVVLMVAGLGVYAILRINALSEDYQYVLNRPAQARHSMLEVQSNVRAMRRVAASLVMRAPTDNTTAINNLRVEGETFYAASLAALAVYEETIRTDPSLTPAEITYRVDAVSQIRSFVNGYQTDVVLAAHNYALARNHAEAIALIDDSFNEIAQLVSLTTYLVSLAEGRMDTIVEEVKQSSQVIIYTTIAVVIAVIIVAIVFAFVVARIISRPVIRLVDVVSDVAKGNLNVNIDRDGITKDEIGDLTANVCTLVDTVKGIVDDLDGMSHNFVVLGHIDHRIDVNKYENSFKEMVKGIHSVVDDLNTAMNISMEALSNISKGNFKFAVNDMPGQKMALPNTIRAVISNIENISRDINTMIESATIKGDMAINLDASGYEGEWKSIVNGLNDVAHAVDEPIIEIRNIMTKVGQADFGSEIVGNYAGDFLAIKNDVNSVVRSLKSYIAEIDASLYSVASGDLTRKSNMKYVGEFVRVGESINNINKTLHKTMSDIFVASEQVLSGAKQIANASTDLANGSQEQAASIEELNVTVDVINLQTQHNADSAKTANELSNKSSTNAKDGNEAMKEMVTAMAKIKESSNNISQIVKTVQDIAFQTNLLALNASVEAARAGEHGKGFAVVAEEVRTLAGRSQEAASQTTTLIQDSIDRVEVGSEIAENTSTSLDVIVSNAEEVLGIIKNITEASHEQALAVAQVTEGLTNVSQVVQDNSAVSQETAAASEELTSQAELLKELVSYFKL